MYLCLLYSSLGGIGVFPLPVSNMVVFTKTRGKWFFKIIVGTDWIPPGVCAFSRSWTSVFAWSCRSSREASADLPHLPPPAACGQPTCREGCRHHAGPLQETVHAERRSRSEDDHESCGAGTAKKNKTYLHFIWNKGEDAFGWMILWIETSVCTFSAELWEVCEIISSPDFQDTLFVAVVVFSKNRQSRTNLITKQNI